MITVVPVLTFLDVHHYILIKLFIIIVLSISVPIMELNVINLENVYELEM
jgi:hypothetical protein